MLKPDHVQNTLSSSTLCKVIPPPLTDVEHRYMYSPVSVVVSGDNAVDSGVLGLGPLWNHWTRNLPLAPITIHLPARPRDGQFPFLWDPASFGDTMSRRHGIYDR